MPDMIRNGVTIDDNFAEAFPMSGTGMRVMLSTTAALAGQERGDKDALVINGRFSVATRECPIGP
jgi:dihydroxyacid dehydratase/phosphogluconate dehydratase